MKLENMKKFAKFIYIALFVMVMKFVFHIIMLWSINTKFKYDFLFDILVTLIGISITYLFLVLLKTIK